MNGVFAGDMHPLGGYDGALGGCESTALMPPGVAGGPGRAVASCHCPLPTCSAVQDIKWEEGLASALSKVPSATTYHLLQFGFCAL